MQRESECIASFQDESIYQFVLSILNERDVAFLTTNKTIQSMVEYVDRWLVNAIVIVKCASFIGMTNINQFKEAYNEFDSSNTNFYDMFVYDNINEIFKPYIVFLKPWLNDILNKVLVDIHKNIVGKVLFYLLLTNKICLHDKILQSYRYNYPNPLIVLEQTYRRITILRALMSKTYNGPSHSFGDNLYDRCSATK